MPNPYSFPNAIADKVGYTQGETGLHSTSPTNRPIRPVGNPGVDESTVLARAAGSFTVTPIESGKIFDLTSGTVMILPAGLTNWSAIFIPPATGSATIRCGAGVTINGAATDISITRASYPKGVSIVPTATFDSYLL